MYVCMYVCMHACMYVCRYVGTYVRVYVCMYRPVHRMASIGLDRDTQFNLTLSMILSRCHLLFLLVQLQKVLAQYSIFEWYYDDVLIQIVASGVRTDCCREFPYMRILLQGKHDIE